MKEFNWDREETRTNLTQKGLIIDDYDKESDTLFKKITEEGKEEIKEILKDPIYLEFFKNMIKDDLKKTNPEFRVKRLKEIMNAMRGL